MITQETASNIWSAYREIEAAEKLLADMAEERAKPFSDHDKYAATLKDAFGRCQHLQLGIPSGSGWHRLFQVRPDLAEAVIRAHIGQMKARLIEANECARVELTIEYRGKVVVVVDADDDSGDLSRNDKTSITK